MDLRRLFPDLRDVKIIIMSAPIMIQAQGQQICQAQLLSKEVGILFFMRVHHRLLKYIFIYYSSIKSCPAHQIQCPISATINGKNVFNSENILTFNSLTFVHVL